jgi:hypothetical protein
MRVGTTGCLVRMSAYQGTKPYKTMSFYTDGLTKLVPGVTVHQYGPSTNAADRTRRVR